MPWGDDRVDQLADELRASWAEVRRDPQSQAPPLSARKRASSPRTAMTLAAGGGALFGALAVLLLQVLAPPTEKRPAGICGDGTPTFAKSKGGACANHGGVQEWYAR